MSDVTFEDHFLMVHWPGLGRAQAVVAELRGDPKTARTPIVLIDDKLDELPEGLARLGLTFIKGNPTKLETLERAHYQRAKQALVLARDQLDPASDHATLAAVLTIEQLRPEHRAGYARTRPKRESAPRPMADVSISVRLAPPRRVRRARRRLARRRLVALCLPVLRPRGRT